MGGKKFLFLSAFPPLWWCCCWWWWVEQKCIAPTKESYYNAMERQKIFLFRNRMQKDLFCLLDVDEWGVFAFDLIIMMNVATMPVSLLFLIELEIRIYYTSKKLYNNTCITTSCHTNSLPNEVKWRRKGEGLKSFTVSTIYPGTLRKYDWFPSPPPSSFLMNNGGGVQIFQQFSNGPIKNNFIFYRIIRCTTCDHTLTTLINILFETKIRFGVKTHASPKKKILAT